MKKKVEVKGIEEALAKLPEGQREDARKALAEFAENFDPSDPPGQAVRSLPAGVSTCPNCNGPLTVDSAGVPLPDGGVVDFMDCATCDCAFAVPAAS